MTKADLSHIAKNSQEHDSTLLQAMPAFYQEDIEHEDDNALRDFLLLLQNAISSLDTQANLAAKPVLRCIRTGECGFERFLFNDVICAEHQVQFTKLTSVQKRHIAQVFTTGSHSWLGAKRIIEILYAKKLVSLEEGRTVQRFLPAKSMTGLQGKNVLGENSVLGHKLEDRMNRCRFYVASLTNSELTQLGSDGYVQLVGELIKQYVQQPMEIELVLVLAAQTEKTTALGHANQAILGAKTWLSAAIGQEKELVFKL